MSKFAPRQVRDTITLPIGDRDFVIASPPYAIGQAAVELVAAIRAAVNDEPLDDTQTPYLKALLEDGDTDAIRTMLLGDTHAEMVEAGVDHATILLAGSTALVWATQGKADAAEFWATGGGTDGDLGKALRLPQDRKPRSAPGKTKPKPKTKR